MNFSKNYRRSKRKVLKFKEYKDDPDKKTYQTQKKTNRQHMKNKRESLSI